MLHFPVARFSASITILLAPWRKRRAGTSPKSKASPLLLTLRIRSPLSSTFTSVTGLARGPKTPPSVLTPARMSAPPNGLPGRKTVRLSLTESLPGSHSPRQM